MSNSDGEDQAGSNGGGAAIGTSVREGGAEVFTTPEGGNPAAHGENSGLAVTPLMSSTGPPGSTVHPPNLSAGIANSEMLPQATNKSFCGEIPMRAQLFLEF